MQAGLTTLVSLGVGWASVLLGFGAREDLEIFFWGLGMCHNT